MKTIKKLLKKIIDIHSLLTAIMIVSPIVLGLGLAVLIRLIQGYQIIFEDIQIGGSFLAFLLAFPIIPFIVSEKFNHWAWTINSRWQKS